MTSSREFENRGDEPSPNSRDDAVKLIAFYLPQYHAIPENDEWWGKGFTEWTNTVQGRPYFDGHYQPHIPGELGFYDLRMAEAREAQADLAREYGIYGFCYYYYWFAGRRLLERPLNDVISSGRPDFPFCICWANENWSRRWDGSESQVLMQQVHDDETDAAFINDVIPIFKDSRYIRLNGAPLLIVYRLSLLPNPARTAAIWRGICAKQGIDRIHLCMAESFGQHDPYAFGFDSAVQFPPHGIVAHVENAGVPSLAADFTGNLNDMRNVVSEQLTRARPLYKRFPAVMPSWDNTARRKKAGNVFINSSPELYETWLTGAIDQARNQLPQSERLVFINAWNEWAEGAHLEPDLRHGRAYLEATKRALDGCIGWRELISYASALEEISGATKANILSSLRTRFENLESINNDAQFQLKATLLSAPRRIVAIAGWPRETVDLPVNRAGTLGVDQVNWHRYPSVPKIIHVYRRQYLIISGWSVTKGAPLTSNTISYVLLTREKPFASYFAVSSERHERLDIVGFVADQMGPEDSLFSGFSICVDIADLDPGRYAVQLAIVHNGETHANDVGIIFHVD